jgi:hypothetical protein
MFAILRGANGRRHEVDFNEDPVIVDVTIGATTIQITMTAADPGDPVKGRYVTVALPRDALTAAMASASARHLAFWEVSEVIRAQTRADLELGRTAGASPHVLRLRRYALRLLLPAGDIGGQIPAADVRLAPAGARLRPGFLETKQRSLRGWLSQRKRK